jgi:hypothetical protein
MRSGSILLDLLSENECDEWEEQALDMSARIEWRRLISWERSWDLYCGWDVSTHFVRGLIRSICFVAFSGRTSSIFLLRFVLLFYYVE